MQELYFDYSNICDSLKQNPNAFFMAVDINGNIRKISQTLLDLLGLREEDALGKCFMDIVPDGKLLEVLKRGHIDSQQFYDIHMFPGLRHNPFIGSNYQHYQVYAKGAGQHMPDKSFVSGVVWQL
jgi:transcriptional regulator with PAS, ATPase and Fis domain